MEQLIAEHLSWVIVALLLGRSGISALVTPKAETTSDLRLKCDKIERDLGTIRHSTEKLVKWHEPEMMEGGTGTNFSWKLPPSSQVGIARIPELMDRLEQLLDRVEKESR